MMTFENREITSLTRVRHTCLDILCRWKTKDTEKNAGIRQSDIKISVKMLNSKLYISSVCCSWSRVLLSRRSFKLERPPSIISLPSCRTSTSHSIKFPLSTSLVMVTNLPSRETGQRTLRQLSPLKRNDSPHKEFSFKFCSS